MDIIQRQIELIDWVSRGEPYTTESAERLCLFCVIEGDCNDRHPSCLLRIAKARDKKLRVKFGRDTKGKENKNGHSNF